MFCEQCGTKLIKFSCPSCGFKKYFNPIPVAISLIPVKKDNQIYLLGIIRNQGKGIGKLALPGGFQEIESLHEAAAREVKEECEIDLQTLTHEPIYQDDALVLSIPSKKEILVFLVFNKTLNYEEINWQTQNSEVQGMELISESSSLAFDLHERAVKWYFNNQSKN